MGFLLLLVFIYRRGGGILVVRWLFDLVVRWFVYLFLRWVLDLVVRCLVDLVVRWVDLGYYKFV